MRFSGGRLTRGGHLSAGSLDGSLNDGSLKDGSFTGGSLASGAGWSRLDWLAAAAVTLVAGLMRLARITRPGEFVFDEIYYAQDACLFVHGSIERCGVAPYTGGHPPLGEWLIGAGILLFGYEPFGWRIVAVVAGTLSVALLYLLARRLLGSPVAASVAAGLLAIDFLHFVHSRVAMLDVFVTFFSIAAFTFAVLDRDALLPDAGRLSRSWLGTPWRFAAGAAAGAAAACKWSGVLALFGVALLVLIWELGSRRRDRPIAAILGTLQRVPSMLLAFGVIPVMVYAASYAGVAQGSVFDSPLSTDSWLRNVVEQQFLMLRVHVTIPGHHPYESPGWAWLLVKQPVAYYFDTFQGRYQEILALGNPLVWWASIPALAFVIYRGVRHRSGMGPEAVIAVGFLVTLLPWLLVVNVRNATFLFYALPTVPFMCLAVTYCLDVLATRWAVGRAAVGVYLAACLAAFAFYYPVLAAVPLDPAHWQARILFNDCEIAGVGYREIPDDETSQGPPPSGWCWR